MTDEISDSGSSEMDSPSGRGGGEGLQVTQLPHCAEPPPLPEEDWHEARRRVRDLFQRYVYGYLPPVAPPATEIVAEREGIVGGRGDYREVRLDCPLPNGRIHSFRVALFFPTACRSPVCTFMAINRVASHMLVEDECVHELKPSVVRPADADLFQAGRGSRSRVFPVEMILERGCALATTSGYEVEPDFPEAEHGVRAKWSGDQHGGSRWGTLAAWAWALHRMADYLTTVDEVDPRRLCVVGHSRRGKAALLAAALDERISLAIPHQSGTGGMALSRCGPSESVEQITTSFPHWFCPDFARFAGREEHLPVDQHMLAALVAPRFLLDTEGFQDDWASPWLAHRSLRLALPAWRSERAEGRAAQVVLDKPHRMDREYWNVFLEFADRLPVS
ncbi:MAG: hypothetical protein ACOC7S_00050 [Planctomycetota bacterium]